MPGPSPLFYKRDYSSLLSTTFPLSACDLHKDTFQVSLLSDESADWGSPASMRLYKSSASACRFPWKLTMMSSSRMAMVWTLGSFFKIPMAVRLSAADPDQQRVGIIDLLEDLRHVAGKDDLSGRR